jgi:maleylpyruvate isomerase
VIRVLRIPYSTNVERVALALAYKGVPVRWIDVDPADRTPVRDVSGQELVPVLVEGGRLAVSDSTEILRYLEERYPEPPLFPRAPARRAELDVFVDWFNRVWKRPPNEIVAERARPEPDHARVVELGRELSGSLELFERVLTGREYLYGDFGAADCIAFPLLKYALDRNTDDDEPFHEVLREFLRAGGRYPRLEAWIRRVDTLPREAS